MGGGQIDDTLDLACSSVDDDYVPLYRGEVQAITVENAVMQPLDTDRNSVGFSRQRDRVLLLEASYPDLPIQVVRIVRMRSVGLCADHLAPVNVDRKALTWVVAQRAPLVKNFSLERDLEHTVQPGIRHQECAVTGRPH